MTTLSVIGLLAAAIIFIVVVWKGMDVFTSTILVSFIIIVTSTMNWWDALANYASGYCGFIASQIFVLVIGAVFGELMGASGAAESIANIITEKLGVKNVILSITVISTVFVYVGISGFVVLFVIAPIATVMMKRAGYAYRMIPGIIFIGATCSAMLPYAINVTNTIPFVAVVVIVLAFSNVSALQNLIKVTDPNAIAVFAMFIGCLLLVLLCYKQLVVKDGLKSIIAKGVDNGVGATVMAAAIIGFSTVLQNSIGFEAIKSWVLGFNMNPYITEFLGLNILAGIMGSGTAAVQTFFQFFTQSLVANGADPSALHRIAPAAVTGLNTLPNAGGMVAQLKWMNITLAEGYWYVFITSVVAPVVGSFVAVLVAIVMY